MSVDERKAKHTWYFARSIIIYVNTIDTNACINVTRYMIPLLALGMLDLVCV